MGINAFGLKWGAPKDEFVACFYELLLGCLANPLHPDLHFANILDVLQPTKMEWSVAQEVLNKAVFPALGLTAKMGVPVFREWFLANVENLIVNDDVNFSQDDKDLLLNIVHDFLEVRRRLMMAIDGERPAYRKFQDYWESLLHRREIDRPGPRMYAHYPFNEGFAYLGQPFEVVNDFVYVHSVNVASPLVLRRLNAKVGISGPVSRILLHSMPNMNPGVDAELSEQWMFFARDIVGCTMLTRGCSARDPVHAYWKSVTARKSGVVIE